MKNFSKIFTLMMCGLLTCLSGCGTIGTRDQNTEPTVVTIWNYYNGSQKEQFDNLVQMFNETEGQEQNIIVDAVSKGTLAELIDGISNSVNNSVGAEPLPNLCAAYADTAYEVNQQELVADITPYLTEEEIGEYVDAYMEEGKFEAKDTLKIFPIAKSTEMLTLNRTAWEPFAKDTGASLEDLSTWEGVAQVAAQYYEWSDGESFFGRDAFANYMLVGSKQLGHEIYRMEGEKPVLVFDKQVMRKLWDNYYVPYIKGYYKSEGKFRSDDLKTGKIIAYVGSTSGATYTPREVTYENGNRESISCQILPVPNFKETEPCAVQQGAGMILIKSDEKVERAAVSFLRWFTEKERNLMFAAGSGYLPVKKEANDAAFLKTEIQEGRLEMSTEMEETLTVGIRQVNQYQMYTTKPFASGNKVRTIINTTMDELAKTNRDKVIELIKNGMNPEDAIAQYNTNEEFEEWYNTTYQELTDLER